MVRTALAIVLLSLVAATCSAATSGSNDNNVAPLRVDGLVAATFTPFGKDGELDMDVVEQQAAWLNATGVYWIFLSGTTGESVKLNTTERVAMAEKWLEVAPGYGIKVIVHVGAESIETARYLARHAESHGAAAVGAMPPVFFKPANTEALALTMASVASAAPSLPFYYYHIPSMTGVAFSDGMFGLVKAMEAANVANFAGIKYTGLYTYPGFMDATRVLSYKSGKYDVWAGRDEMMVEALSVGISGFVGSQYNMIGDLFNAIRGAVAANEHDTARALQLLANDFIHTWQTAVPAGVNGCKNVFNIAPHGINVGDARLPSVPLSSDARQQLAESIKAWCAQTPVAGWPAKTRLCSGA